MQLAGGGSTGWHVEATQAMPVGQVPSSLQGMVGSTLSRQMPKHGQYTGLPSAGCAHGAHTKSHTCPAPQSLSIEHSPGFDVGRHWKKHASHSGHAGLGVHWQLSPLSQSVSLLHSCGHCWFWHVP